MTVLATSADVALTTIRSHRAALAKARALLDAASAAAVFLDDIIGHYDVSISDLEKGMRPSDLIPGTVSGMTFARSAGSFGCFVGLLDIAQALGVQVEILKAGG